MIAPAPQEERTRPRKGIAVFPAGKAPARQRRSSSLPILPSELTPAADEESPNGSSPSWCRPLPAKGRTPIASAPAMMDGSSVTAATCSFLTKPRTRSNGSGMSSHTGRSRSTSNSTASSRASCQSKTHNAPRRSCPGRPGPSLRSIAIGAASPLRDRFRGRLFHRALHRPAREPKLSAQLRAKDVAQLLRLYLFVLRRQRRPSGRRR